MDTTSRAPDVPVASFKRTKILATLGPATNSYEAILALIKAGANGLRLNFSHGTPEQHAQHIKWIRKAATEFGKPVAIIQDLQGPKIRLGDFDGIINVTNGKQLSFQYQADFARSGHIPTQYDLSKKVKRGERLYLYDGKVHTTVTSVKDGVVYVEAENDGILISRKGINLPDTDFGGDIITAKDLKDISFASTKGIDYVALSFVQTVADIHELRLQLKNHNNHAKIIAKIETKQGLRNVGSIIEEADAVMIARGDLAVETSSEDVPLAQRKIIELGLLHAKPVIVATQMLLSMVDSPEPTRAEVSDVAGAVIDGADCVMLSEETASGKYPLESVKMMKRIIRHTQNHTDTNTLYSRSKPRNSQNAISAAVINLAETLDASAIVAETKSGATALQIAARRPRVPLIAVTSVSSVAQQLAIVYGVKSYVRPDSKFAATKLTDWLHRSKVLHEGDIVVTASGKYPGMVGTTDTIKVRVL